MAKHSRSDAPNTGSSDLDNRRPSDVLARHAAPTRLARRRVLGVVVAAVVGIVGIFFLVGAVKGGSPDPTVAQAPATSPSLTSTPAAVAPDPDQSAPDAAATTPPASSSPVRSAPVLPPPASLPQSGPGLIEPGILLLASPGPDGTFDVLERIRTADPVTALTLRPAAAQQAGQQFAAVSAAAAELTLTAGDQRVAVPSSVIDSVTTVPVAEGDQFELRYRLTDVTVRSTPSSAGRALAVLGPLTGGMDGELPVRIIVSGETVLGLNCPLLPFSEQACGQRAATVPGVERELPAGVALTTVQFDLPPA